MRSVFALLVLLAAPLSAHALTYAEWIAGYPSLTGDAALATSDPDEDGFVNLMEYAISGMDPTVGMGGVNAAMPKPYFVLRAEDGTYGSPVTSYTQAQAAAAASLHLVIRFQPRAGVTDIRYSPETNSRDLNHWGWGDSAIIEWDADGYRWARTLSDMKVWQERAFMRLRVEVIQ